MWRAVEVGLILFHSGDRGMVRAILCGLLFGFVGLYVGGIVAEGAHCSKEVGAALLGAGAMLGAIFGAVVGGTGAIVDAIKRSTPGAEPGARWSPSKTKWIVAGVVLLAAIVAMTAALIHGVNMSAMALLAAMVAFVLYLVLRPG
jgi:hypothetical protein